MLVNRFGGELSLYPNPPHGEFLIDLKETVGYIHLEIMDMTGKVIMSETYENKELLELNLEGPDGVYILRIESEGKSAVIRLIKN